MRFTEEQIIKAQREVDACAKAADLARKHGVCALHNCDSEGNAAKLDGEVRMPTSVRGQMPTDSGG